MPKIFITQVCDMKNKGDQAILKSEITLLRDIWENVEIAASTEHVKALKELEPNIEACSPLVDLKVKGKSPPLILYPPLFILQVFFSMISIVFARASLRPVYRPEVIKQYKYADLVISSGHEPFQEGSIYCQRYPIARKIATFLTFFWGVSDVFIVKKVFKKPFITFPQSFGPIKTHLGLFAARFILNNIDLMVLREPYSLKFLKKVKKDTPVQVLADIAFLFRGFPKSTRILEHAQIGVSPGIPYLFSVGFHQKYVIAHSKTLDDLVKKYDVDILLFPSRVGKGGVAEEKEGFSDDRDICEMIMQNMVHKDRVRIVNVTTVQEFATLLGCLDLLIATRMHPSVLALINFVPFVQVVYEHKQTGLLELLGLEELGININDLSYETLISKVEFVWENRKKIREQLALRIPALQNRTRMMMTKNILGFISQ
jgi:polysaccharide pyruvyl transferase WcaK-like protein